MPKGDKLKGGKREAFCQEYIIDFNGTQAAIRAKYSKKTAQEQSSQLLSKLIIQARIKELMAAREKRLEHSADEVIRRLWKTNDLCLVPDDKDRIDSSGSNRSLELLGRHYGNLVERKEIKHDMGSALMRKIAKLIDEGESD